MNWYSPDAVREFLTSLSGMTDPLLRHSETVASAAERLGTKVHALRDDIDVPLVVCGALLHDCGKSVHPEELAQTGKRHEHAGRMLLIAAGAPADVANFCVFHGNPARTDVDGAARIEHWIVACADKVWKGERVFEWEHGLAQLIDASDPWRAMTQLDVVLESLSGSVEAES